MDLSILPRFALLLVRPGMLIMAAPSFGGTFAPAPVRLGLTVFVAVSLLPVVGLPDAAGTVAIAPTVLRELAIGLAIAMAVRAVLAGAELAGHLAGFQIGFAYGSLVDPQSGARHTHLAVLYGNLALLAFLAANGHHALLRAITSSYVTLPVGSGAVNASLVPAITELLGIVFVLGVRLAMPVIVLLLCLELALGLMARAAPGINLMIVGMPIRIIVGLLVVALVVPIMPTVVVRFITPALDAGLRAARAFR
jgi:flagellar biosynthesis protein FliR